MKRKTLKALKAVTLSVVAFVVFAVGMLATNVNASATEVVGTETSGVIYVQYKNGLNYDEYWGEKAPEYTGVDQNGIGYFFGGWYAKKGNTYSPIEDKSELETAEVVAKFVPAQTMSVKCQNWAGTNEQSDQVVIRVISATDSINYSKFGFVVSKIVDGVEGKLNTFETDTVYQTFNYYESQDDTTPTSYVPSELFGAAATRFTTCTVGKIPVGKHDTIICIKPFWETLDGVKVSGLSKFAHVEDGYLGYVNVPINLNNLDASNGAAAGILSVKSNDGLEFVGAEQGKVFDEMAFNVLNDGTIKCVGNTSDISDKTTMDVYINLKFKKTEKQFYTFTVGDEDFVNKDEIALNKQDVWNVIY